jgi:hypothetical protein
MPRGTIRESMRYSWSALILRLPYTAFSTTCISAKRLLVSMENCVKSVIDDCNRAGVQISHSIAWQWQVGDCTHVKSVRTCCRVIGRIGNIQSTAM